MNRVENIRFEILQASYWEHFKVAKDMARYLAVDHPKRIAIEAELTKLSNYLTSHDNNTQQ